MKSRIAVLFHLSILIDVCRGLRVFQQKLELQSSTQHEQESHVTALLLLLCASLRLKLWLENTRPPRDINQYRYMKEGCNSTFHEIAS